MGVKGLSQFLRNKYPSVFQTSDLSDFTGLRFAVDVSIFLYKFAYCKDPDDDHLFLEKFLKQYRMFCTYNIAAVYVFDGLGEHVGKEVERAKRARQVVRATELREAKICTLEALLETGETMAEEKIKHLRLAVTVVKPIHSTNLKALFQIHNIPFYEAKNEAEKACAWLASEGLVDVVVSEDYDTLVCGAPRLLRNLGSTKYPLLELRLSNILNALQMTYAQFVDFCILCGTDFNASLPLIGPVKAFRKIHEHVFIENVLLSEPVHAGNASVMAGFTFEMARSKFLDTEYPLTTMFLDSERRGCGGEAANEDVYAMDEDLVFLYTQLLDQQETHRLT